MRNIKPIYIVFQNGIPPGIAMAIYRAAYQLIYLAGVANRIEIRNFGFWRNPNWQKPNGELTPFSSVDWYIKRGKETSRNRIQLNADTIFSCLIVEPWQQSVPHYDLFVTKDDLYSENTNFVLGIGSPGIGTVLSVNRLLSLNSKREETIQTLVFHEFGHAFGLIPDSRNHNVENSLGRHCTVYGCTMRQGLSVTNWSQFTHERLQIGKIYCDHCEQDLKNWFN